MNRRYITYGTETVPWFLGKTFLSIQNKVTFFLQSARNFTFAYLAHASFYTLFGWSFKEGDFI